MITNMKEKWNRSTVGIKKLDIIAIYFYIQLIYLKIEMMYILFKLDIVN